MSEHEQSDHLLVAEAVVAGYLPGINILEGCDLTLDEGEIVGIIGPNGAGERHGRLLAGRPGRTHAGSRQRRDTAR